MKRTIALTLALLILLVPSAFALKRSYEHLTVKQVKQMMDDGEDMVFVDARPKEYYEATHIPSAINIPLTALGDDETYDLLPDLGQTIIVYCYTGIRSREAASILGHMGYTQVREFGGLILWTGKTAGTEEIEEYYDDPFEAKEYANPDDFYYEFEEEFDDYEEAEEYYYEHGGW